MRVGQRVCLELIEEDEYYVAHDLATTNPVDVSAATGFDLIGTVTCAHGPVTDAEYDVFAKGDEYWEGERGKYVGKIVYCVHLDEPEEFGTGTFEHPLHCPVHADIMDCPVHGQCMNNNVKTTCYLEAFVDTRT